jgi:hypothetical protein
MIKNLEEEEKSINHLFDQSFNQIHKKHFGHCQQVHSIN